MTGPIATVGDMHTCPMVTGVVPHVGGPIIGPGCPGATINGKPIAVVGDMCACSGPPDTIVMGCPGVTINGKPIATVGDLTAHGGVITMGCPGVIISTSDPAIPPAVTPISQIPFPDISILDRIGAAVTGHGSQLKEAEARQEEIKKVVSEAEPHIYNLQWMRKDAETYEGLLQETMVLHADTSGYADGETVKVSVYYSQGDEELVEELSGEVRNGCIDIEWLVDKEKVKLEND